MVLQNGNFGGTFSPTSPMGRIIFEGTGLNVQQDVITLEDSNQGVNLFSNSGFRPQANADDCAISGDGGLALRCGNTISNYIGTLPDGSSWLERLTTAPSPLKSFTVPITTNSVISSTLTSGAPFSVMSTTPVTNLVSQSAQGLVLSGTTLAIGGSSLNPGYCTSGTATVTGATTSMVAIASPTADPLATGTPNGLAIWAYVSAVNTVTVEVCAIVMTTPVSTTYNVRVSK
jgi:hypothetical protein